MSGRGREQCVKVVIINTKYVETDAMSFKDVVQSLTGKDSRVAYEVQEPNAKTSQYFFRDDQQGINGIGSTAVNVGMSWTNSVLMRDFSFKEFDRLLREMPPMEEFWAD